MKYCFAFALALVAYNAEASYELLLVGDSAGKCVHRYDPISGTYLGSFGKGMLAGVSAIAVNQTDGTAFVYDPITFTLHKFNYSTGIPIKSISENAGGGSLQMVVDGNSGDLFFQGGVYVRRFNTNLNHVGTYFAPSQNPIKGITITSTGNLVSYDTTTSKVVKWDLNVQGAGQEQTNALPLVNPTHIVAMPDGDAMILNGSSSNMLRLFDTNNIYGNSFSLLGLYTGVTVVRGHTSNYYAIGKNSIGTTLMDRFVVNGTLFGAEIDQLSLSQVSNPTCAAIVLAPEPGTIIAMAAGSLALLMRRRRK